jgi:hypothetical protein
MFRPLASHAIALSRKMPQKTAVSGVFDFPQFTGIPGILKVSTDSAATFAASRESSEVRVPIVTFDGIWRGFLRGNWRQ